MKIDCIQISRCSEQQVAELTEFAFSLNNIIEHSSTFCSSSKSAIIDDFMDGISHNNAYACRKNDEIAGVINCYVDDAKNNVDCILLIDPGKCNYIDTAGLLFNQLRASLGTDMKYTFYFPKENVDCTNFLESIQAERKVNEYMLVLEKGHAKTYKSDMDISELPKEYYREFIELHDNIFPEVYISGAEIIEDLGKKHTVYSIIKEGILIAYSVLKFKGGKRATAEIVAVKENFRGKGYGRAILSYLIDTVFSSFGVSEIDLIVDGDNENAISLYLDLGFVIEFENRCYIAVN